MHLARVVGTVVSTIKDEALKGAKLLIIEPLSHDLKPAGERLVAVDAIGVGYGEHVFFERSREATVAFPDRIVPADAAILAVVERVDL